MDMVGLGSRSLHLMMSRSTRLMSSHYKILTWKLVFLLCAGHCAVTPLTDFRVIPYQELSTDQGAVSFSAEGVSEFSRITIDNVNNQVLVGARDYLARLELDSLDLLESSWWPPVDAALQRCQAHGQSPEVCHNFVRVLELHRGRVLTCGTNAFNPLCAWRSVMNISHVDHVLSGLAKCPFDPRHNSTAIMTDNGDLYSGTVTDYAARDPVIFRMLGPSAALRTVRRNSLWLNEPNFVSSYEMNEFIYFFFREPAVEYINCGKSVYSRVARICKSDMGGHFVLEDNWTTFMKARLNCSLPGDYPFYFNELQGTYLLEQEQLIYAIFTTSPTSIYGSAVCVYNTTSFNNAFTSPFKYQASALMSWVSEPNSQPQCASASQSTNVSALRTSATPAQKHLLQAQKYQMMDSSVQPLQQLPLVVAENERFSHIAVDEVPAKHHLTFRVIFLATLEGVIKKFINVPESNLTCLVEELHATPSNDPHPVLSFKLDAKQGALYVGLKDTVRKIPVQRCRRFNSKLACLNAQDPYCGWHTHYRACIPVPNELPDPDWHQEIISCPVLRSREDGGWSSWSPWESCDHQQISGDKCLCQTRSCDSPAPRYGGQPCPGSKVKVTNCTVHGGWSQWSDWPACPVTCGSSTRSRYRTCTNPPPAHGGRQCAGSSVDTSTCVFPSCPAAQALPVDGGWSHWSDWTLCDKKCDGGLMNRSRACTDPPPYSGGRPCTGNDHEWQRCNIHQCPEVRKNSGWTAWLESNTTGHGHSRSRFRFVCRSRVADQSQLTVSLKQQDQRCNGQNCGNPGKRGWLKILDRSNSGQMKSVCGEPQYDHSIAVKDEPRSQSERRLCHCRNIGRLSNCQRCNNYSKAVPWR